MPFFFYNENVVGVESGHKSTGKNHLIRILTADFSCFIIIDFFKAIVLVMCRIRLEKYRKNHLIRILTAAFSCFFFCTVDVL